MTHQQLRVSAIPWQDAPSGQKTVEFSTAEGVKFTCLVDGGDVTVGKMVNVVEFDYLEAEGEFFALNPTHDRTVTQLGEWDVEIRGRIVALANDTVLVDCGGVVMPLHRLTGDASAVGSWVGAVLRRLEAEVE